MKPWAANFGDERLPCRFWEKVYPCPMSGCWVWLAAADRGYGHYFISRKRKSARAHRVAYETLVGAIPDVLELDHLCRVRYCVNPAHLEPVTRSQNMLRSPLRRCFATHCPNGHEYTEQNTKIKSRGSRMCIACNAAGQARYHAKARAKVADFVMAVMARGVP
jgi:hypothetical protein